MLPTPLCRLLLLLCGAALGLALSSTSFQPSTTPHHFGPSVSTPTYGAPSRHDQQPFPALGDPSPPCQWTWTSWNLGGPTCSRFSQLSHPDLKGNGPVNSTRATLSLLLNAFIASFKQANLDLGMVLGIAYKGQTIFLDGAGSVQMGSAQKPNGDTVFGVGSVTKVFTSAMLMQLIGQGVVDLDQPLTDFFNPENPPEFSIGNPYGATLDGVNMHSLATHTSGLPREPPCGVYNLPGCDEPTTMALVNQMNLINPPFTKPHYSNLGSALLSRALARAVGSEYEDYMLANITGPLGMSSTVFDRTSGMQARMASPYTIDSSGKQIPDPLGNRSMGWANGAGGLLSSVSDLLVFLNSLLGHSGSSCPLLPHTLSEFLLPGIEMPDQISGYGLGTWESAFSNGFRMLTKGGLTSGFGTSIVLVPDLDLCAAAFVNLDSSAPESLTARALNIVVPALVSEITANQPSPPLPQVYKALLGGYGPGGASAQMKEGTAPGILQGSVLGTPSTFIWDSAQETPRLKAMGLIAAFRYYNGGPYQTCQAISGAGDNSVVYFFKDPNSGGMLAYFPDVPMTVAHT